MADQNKVKFGLEKVAFAVATIAADGSATYGTPIMCPGARSISLDPQGELTPWPADNIAGYFVANDNNGYSGDLEVARFPDAIMAAIWSAATAGNGIVYERANVQAVHFALLFEFSGDVNHTRHVFYNCVGTRPAVASETTGDTTEPTTETTTITATSIYVSALDDNVVKAKCVQGDTAYDDWYEAVTLPTAASTTTNTNP